MLLLVRLSTFTGDEVVQYVAIQANVSEGDHTVQFALRLSDAKNTNHQPLQNLYLRAFSEPEGSKLHTMKDSDRNAAKPESTSGQTMLYIIKIREGIIPVSGQMFSAQPDKNDRPAVFQPQLAYPTPHTYDTATDASQAISLYVVCGLHAGKSGSNASGSAIFGNAKSSSLGAHM